MHRQSFFVLLLIDASYKNHKIKINKLTSHHLLCFISFNRLVEFKTGTLQKQIIKVPVLNVNKNM